MTNHVKKKEMCPQHAGKLVISSLVVVADDGCHTRFPKGFFVGRSSNSQGLTVLHRIWAKSELIAMMGKAVSEAGPGGPGNAAKGPRGLGSDSRRVRPVRP